MSMKQYFTKFRKPGFRCRELLFLLVLLASIYHKLAAQVPPPSVPASESAKAHFAAAQAAQQQQDYPNAESEYHEVITLAPEFAEAHMNLGLVYQLENRVAEAMTEFRRALKIKP